VIQTKPMTQEHLNNRDIVYVLNASQFADLITPVIQEYNKEHKRGTLTPELVTKTFQTIWQERGRLAGIKFEVTPCPFTKEELADLEKKELRLGYLPTALATQESRHILGKMFPKMQSRSVQEGNGVANDGNPFGWFDYEVSVNAPHTKTTVDELMNKLGKAKRQLLSLNQYLIASQDSKLFKGQYLDEGNTRARVGSRSGSDLINAYIDPDGYLHVDWFLPRRDSYPDLGGRSSGVNRA